MAAKAVTISGGVGQHKGKCANCEVRIPHIQYGSVSESYIFSLLTTLLFWTMSKCLIRAPITGRRDTPPAVAIQSVATATTSLSSRMGPLIAQY